VNFRLAVADSLTDLKVQDRLVAVHRRGLQAKKMMAGAPSGAPRAARLPLALAKAA
jgi:hypothetical protein